MFLICLFFSTLCFSAHPPPTAPLPLTPPPPPPTPSQVVLRCPSNGTTHRRYQLQQPVSAPPAPPTPPTGHSRRTRSDRGGVWVWGATCYQCKGVQTVNMHRRHVGLWVAHCSGEKEKHKPRRLPSALTFSAGNMRYVSVWTENDSCKQRACRGPHGQTRASPRISQSDVAAPCF